MKVLLIVLSLMFMFGCNLNEESQRCLQTIPRQPPKEKIIIREYYDVEGNKITDPELLEKIKSL